MQSVFGLVAFVLIAWLLSEDRRALPWRIVVSGALLQIVLAAALLKLPLFRDVFLALNDLLSAPERRDEIVALGLRSIVAGTLATLMTGSVVGMLI